MSEVTENSTTSAYSSQDSSVAEIFASLLENKYIISGVLCLLIINIIIVDILFFSSRKTTEVKENVTIPALCPQSCLTQFSERISSLQPQNNNSATVSAITPATPTSIPPAVTNTPTPSASPSATPTPVTREYFIPLGQGNGSYTDWTVVPGIGAKVNYTSYGKIEKVYFEATTVRVPAGSQIVYVRLYNANSGQNIVNSDLTLTSNTSTLLTSKEISLIDTKDENLYQVQLKTQLGSTTYIDQARLRIVTR